jgi:mannose-1-phosphate guanylyltransferase
MKHVSQYETDEWANARDRRRSRRQEEELLYKLD